MAKNSGIVSVKDTDLTVAQVIEVLKSGGSIELEVSADDDLHGAIMERKMAATSAAELLAPAELIKARDILGQSFELRSVEVRPSDEAYQTDGNLGIYVILHTSIGTIGTGSEDVVVTSLRLVELGELPQLVQITGNTTKGGFNVLNMVAGEAPF